MPVATRYGTLGTETGLSMTSIDRQPVALPGVVFCHGRGGKGVDEVSPAAATTSYRTLRTLAEAGFPVLSPDLGGTATWGNDASVTKIGDAKTYLQGTLGAKAGGVFLYGGSMGTLTALNYAKANPSSVLGMVMVLPAVDLADIHDFDRNSYAAEINTAYTDLAGYTAAVGTHNPAVNTASFTGLPMQLWYSSDDTIVLPATVAAFGAATGAQLVNMGAVAHTNQAVAARSVLEFFRGLL